MCLAGFLLACNFVPDNQPPRGIDGLYTGEFHGTNPTRDGVATAELKADELSVTGTVAVATRGCRLVFQLRGARDARFLDATLTASAATLSFSGNTLLDRIVGTYRASTGEGCVGAEGTLDLTKDPG